ncbi:MAG: ribosome assembly RNA-binding protein YhbY [Clostridia bacterium]
MTSKERATLRGLAMKISPLTTVGKSGVSEQLLQQVDEQLEARELIKITVLKNFDLSASEIAQEIADKTESELVQVIGSKITLYRLSSRKDICHIMA